jgi:hypothetical protein
MRQHQVHEVSIAVADSVTFGWFVKEKYLPIRRGGTATREKTEFEINKYLVKEFENVPLRTIGLFELQKLLNDLAEKYSESVVKHAFVNLRSVLKLAQKLRFISDNLGEKRRCRLSRLSSGPR